MSIELIGKASKLDFPNEPILKFTLIGFCNYANQDDEAWPSYPTLAKFCSVSERTAYRHVKELEKRGYITKENRTHKDGRNRSNLYKINLSPLTQCHPHPDTVTPSPLTQCHPSKENHHKEPSKEDIGHSENDQDSDNLFSDFYKAYPKKVKGDRALKVWNEKKLWRYWDDIKANIEQRKKCQQHWVTCKGQQKQFIPSPDVYLRNKGWNDELELSHKDCKQCSGNKQKSFSNEYNPGVF